MTLEVPDLSEGVKFYTDAGLVADVDDLSASFRCERQDRPVLNLIKAKNGKRLHHIALRADGLDDIAACVGPAGGRIVRSPNGFSDDGLWIADPHGMVIHLMEHVADADLVQGKPFDVNGPGRLVRVRQSAMLPVARYDAVKPLRLGHVLTFSPDVPTSVAFMVDCLGMGLADQAQDVIAFCCATKNSDHHVVAFAKSSGVGMHHVSFQVADPDEVGRGGRALLTASGRGDWGFGRHTIGSNFFHYIQDPWGSWFEYYSDMDFIDDHKLWTSTNYEMEDSLANWGPSVPSDFVHNYELAAGSFGRSTADAPRLETH